MSNSPICKNKSEVEIVSYNDKSEGYLGKCPVCGYVNYDITFIDEIEVISVWLRKKDNYGKIADIIQKVMPYHLVAVLYYGNESCISLAEKEISKKDKDKRVIRNSYISDMYKGNEAIWSSFLISIQFSFLPLSTMRDFYKEYILRIKNLEVAKVTGEFSITDENKTEIDNKMIKEKEEIEYEISKLKALIKAESRFSDKVDLNVIIRENRSLVSKLKVMLLNII